MHESQIKENIDKFRKVQLNMEPCKNKTIIKHTRPNSKERSVENMKIVYERNIYVPSDKLKFEGGKKRNKSLEEIINYANLFPPTDFNNEKLSLHNYQPKCYKETRKGKTLSTSELMFSGIYRNTPSVKFDSFSKIFHLNSFKASDRGGTKKPINSSLLYSLSKFSPRVSERDRHIKFSNEFLKVNSSREKIVDIQINKEISHNCIKKKAFYSKFGRGTGDNLFKTNPLNSSCTSSPKNNASFSESKKKTELNLKNHFLTLDFDVRAQENNLFKDLS